MGGSVVQQAYREFLFWSKVSEGDNGCWNWTGYTRPGGYGQVGEDSAHRRSWKLTRGDIPPGIYVCHKCDNRRCVNPDHLFLGTALENSLDAKRKGRTKGGKPQGVSHRGKHERVRAMLDAGIERKAIAKVLGMTDRNVYYIQKKYRSGDEFRREGRDPAKFTEHHRKARENYNKKRRDERAARRNARRGGTVSTGPDPAP